MKYKTIISMFAVSCMLTTINAQERNTIDVPNLDGYETLKCDFHIHTVYSDGSVWPTVRVDEAYREGLDAIAITEHIEYRPRKNDLNGDHNRSYEVAKPAADNKGIILIKGSEITRDMAPGHSNAIFITDSNPLEQKEWRDAYKAAKKQNGFIFWNHPGWKVQQPDTTLWWPEHTELHDAGMLNGIEVANSKEYFPEAIDWCIEKNMTMLSNSDTHNPTGYEYNFEAGAHRTMTFVFAKERSAAAIREALEARRTMAWIGETVIGREDLAKEFFEKSVKIDLLSSNAKGSRVKITNVTDLTIIINGVKIKPSSSNTLFIAQSNAKELSFNVDNFLVGGRKSLRYSVSL